ncbi:Regulator of rDNA transcription protein 15 [Capsicum baccatum]|uniref:Regulator of rDNA transcription protein 15 n=1 Tax=Capsicum baccatum TaxID=33114 RepID=A0A2G2UZN0_CAPBA|nr:Regulator of rDNA transcription protein 15 [Capsicum baccatum]
MDGCTNLLWRREERWLDWMGRDEPERQRAESQWIVAARPLCHLQYPVAYLSRLQRILPAARWKLYFNCTLRRPPRSFRRGGLANDTCPWGSRPLLRVGKRTAGTCVACSPDSDLEAFSHNPAHGSFAPLAFQPSAMTNCVNQLFLSAWSSPRGQHPGLAARTIAPPRPNSSASSSVANDATDSLHERTMKRRRRCYTGTDGSHGLAMHAAMRPRSHVPYWWVNNPTLGEFCFTMIGRADIEGSKSNVAMNAWLPQASYPCANFSDTSSFEFRRPKGSLGHAFTVRIRTGSQNQTSFYPSVPYEISVLVELILGHMRYLLTDVPPQPNSPPENVFRPDRPAEQALGPKRGAVPHFRFME